MAHRLLLLLAALAGAHPATAALPQRKIFAWASPSNATIAQLTNASWLGVFDGVHAGCGVDIAPAPSPALGNSHRLAPVS